MIGKKILILTHNKSDLILFIMMNPLLQKKDIKEIFELNHKITIIHYLNK